MMYEYLVVTTDHKSFRIMADSVKGVLAAIDEEKTPILNIFRNVAVSEGNRSEPAKVSTKVYPDVAIKTGCHAFPGIPVLTAQGKQITLSAAATEGWKFDGWYLKGKKVSSLMQDTIVNQEAGEVIYEAHFIPAA